MFAAVSGNAGSAIGTLLRAGRTRAASGMAGQTVAITGASGMVGTALTEYLTAREARVLRVVRRAPSSDDELQWSPKEGKIDEQRLAEADAVVRGVLPQPSGLSAPGMRNPRDARTIRA